MSEGKPIPVRFTPEIIQRLDAAVKKTGMNTRASIIKLCVSGFLEYFERTGIAGLPFNYKEILHAQDGRVQRFKNINVVAHQSVVNGDMINNHELKVAESPAKYGKRKRTKEGSLCRK